MSGLLTTAELCSIIGVCEETAYRRATRGDWPAYRAGAELRWSLEEVLAAMRAERERRISAPDERSVA